MPDFRPDTPEFRARTAEGNGRDRFTRYKPAGDHPTTDLILAMFPDKSQPRELIRDPRIHEERGRPGRQPNHPPLRDVLGDAIPAPAMAIHPLRECSANICG